MVTIFRLIALCFIIYAYAPVAWSWNAYGHRLIAQIAYNNLSQSTQLKLASFYQANNATDFQKQLRDSAVWLDALRSCQFHGFDHFHYESQYFSQDGTSIKSLNSQGKALWAIKSSINCLKNPALNAFDHKICLNVLLHVVGDIHQPLHTVSRVSKRYPLGDKGGNLYRIYHNKTAKNLHSYWDKGGGYLKGNQDSIVIKAKELNNDYPCTSFNLKANPHHWLHESSMIALNAAYQLPKNRTLRKQYKQKTQMLSKKQIVLSGCRIAALIDKLL